MTGDVLTYRPVKRGGISRKRVRVFVTAALIVVALYLLGMMLWPPVERWLYWRRIVHECKTYQSPPNTLIYYERPKVGPYKPTTPYFMKVMVVGRHAEFNSATARPLTAISFSGMQSYGTVVLHELRTPAGEHVIVHVGQDGTRPADGAREMKGYRYRAPRAGMDAILFTLTVDWPAICGPYESLKLYAGRPNPTDPSSFVLDFECDERAGQIVGTLQADDSVKLTAHFNNP